MPKRLHGSISNPSSLVARAELGGPPRTIIMATRYGSGRIRLKASSWSSTAGSPSISACACGWAYPLFYSASCSLGGKHPAVKERLG